MDYDLTRTVSSLTVSVMSLILMFFPLLLILAYVFIRRAYPDGHKGIILGIASFFIICNVWINLVDYAGEYLSTLIFTNIQNEWMKTALENIWQVLWLLIECALIVLCIELAYRYFSYQPEKSGLGNAFTFALGFSLIDAIIVELSIFDNWLIGVSINGVGLEGLVEMLESEDVEQFLTDMEPLLSATVGDYLLAFFERIVFAAFIFAVVALIYLISKKLLNYSFLMVIMGFYFGYYLPTLLQSIGLYSADVITLVWIILLTVFLWLFTWQVMKKVSPEDTKYLSELKSEGIMRIIIRGRATSSFSKKDKA